MRLCDDVLMETLLLEFMHVCTFAYRQSMNKSSSEDGSG